MPSYSSLGGVPVDAFQWMGDPISKYELPSWAYGSAHVEAPGHGALEVTCYNGRTNALVSEWVVQHVDGSVSIIPDALFRLNYDVKAAEAKAAKDQEAAETKPEPAAKKPDTETKSPPSPVKTDSKVKPLPP